MTPTMTPKDLRRFTRKYINTGPGGCWLWTAGKNEKGYGTFSLDGEKRKAHRVAYEQYVGPIPDGLEIDHLCRHRGCVNPAHLEAVTHAENMARGANAMKTHCARGHEYAGDNVYRTPDGRRDCRVCVAARGRAYRARKAGA